MSLKCFYCHDTPKSKRIWNDDYIQILAIDPARLNFALRVERRYLYGENKGKMETILFWKKDFSKNTLVSILQELDLYSNIYLDTHVFIIERQMKKLEMLLIMQHLLTYFMLKTKNSRLCPDIIEISAKIKGKQLGYDIQKNKNGEKGEKGKVIKKWSSELARKMLIEREDFFGIEVMDFWLSKQHSKNVRKDDDLADTVVMCEAYFQMKFDIYHQDMIFLRLQIEKMEKIEKTVKQEGIVTKKKIKIISQNEQSKVHIPETLQTLETKKIKKRIKILPS